MGTTNFQSSFNHKFSLLSGELADKRKQVERMREALPGLEAEWLSLKQSSITAHGWFVIKPANITE